MPPSYTKGAKRTSHGHFAEQAYGHGSMSNAQVMAAARNGLLTKVCPFCNTAFSGVKIHCPFCHKRIIPLVPEK